MKMKPKNKKISLSNLNIGLDRHLLNDKRNPNNYLYSYLKKGLNSSKNTKNNHNSSELMKKSSSQFFGNKNNNNKSINNSNNLNIKDKPINQIIQVAGQKNSSKLIKHIRKNTDFRLNNDISPTNYNKKFNTSMFINKRIKSVPRNNKQIKIIYTNNSFVNSKRTKTPILKTNENNHHNLRVNYDNDLQRNKDYKMNRGKLNKNFNYNLSINGNNSFRNNNNLFRPVNIFSQFKQSKGNINEERAKNSQLFKKFLIEEQKNTINQNKSHDINNNNINNNNIINNYKIINNDKYSNRTNNMTPISNDIFLNNRSNSNKNLNFNKKNKIVFDNNIDCHEINFHVRGVSSSINLNINYKSKKKIFKGKKIKCMHDLSKTGLSGDDKKVNQDNFFIFKNFVQGFDNIFMGVCDGHGYYGHEVSGFIKENLPMNLNHLIKSEKLNVLTDDLSSVIKRAFISENKSLLRNKQIDSDLSGSTCISVIYTPKKLIIANVGDSRCFLGKCIEKENLEETGDNILEENKKKVKWIAENLSRDHKPTITEEAERILKVGGRIRPMKDEDGEFIGPLRVYMKDRDMPGLAMTRSFGDYFGSTAGVIPEPEVTEYFFKPEDKFMVLASDGLFEFMESQEIVDIIKDYYNKNDIVGCCEYLYKESTRRWLQEEEDTIDDITIILVFFDDLFSEVEE